MGADSPLGRLRARALGQPKVTRRGAFTDARGPSLRMLEWSVPEDVDVSDARKVKQANPASWISLEALREQQEAVAPIAFERYHANRWVARVGSWLPPGASQACAGEVSFEDGERIWVGVDVGGERSDTVVVWVNEGGSIGCQTWSGEEAVLEIAPFVHELAERYAVAEVSADPWRAAGVLQDLNQRGILVTSFPQSDSRMITASEQLYDEIGHKRLTHPDDETLNAHVHAAVAKSTRRGWRLDQATKAGKIDAVVALAMAVNVRSMKAGFARRRLARQRRS